VAKWYCGNILDFHDRRSEKLSVEITYYTKIIDRRIIAERCLTVGCGQWRRCHDTGTNIGGTCPAQSAGIFFFVPLHFLKCPLKWRGTPRCSGGHAFAVLCL